MVDVSKNGSPSARHALADCFTDQREVWLRFMTSFGRGKFFN
jgi:hypothetical protein